MMKIRTTRKELRKSAFWSLSVGYCDLQYLLKYEQPFAYVSGTYGWDFDAYLFGDIVVTTGYRGMVGFSIPYDDVAEIEKRAEKIVYNHDIPYEEKRKALHEIAVEFFEQQLRKAHEKK